MDSITRINQGNSPDNVKNCLKSRKKPSNSLKIMSWNSGNMKIIESIGYELRAALDKFVLLSINETRALQDLSSLNLIGFRHQAEITRGLCVYISSTLQHYTTCNESKYSLFGTLNLPTIDNYDPVKIGFISM